MASAKKPNARRRAPPAGQEGVPDAPSPAIVNGATAPLRVVPPPTVPDPEVRERAVRRRFTAEYRSEEHTSELQPLAYLVCRLLLEKKKTSPKSEPNSAAW